MSESREVWSQWFERLGATANADAVNATAELVIAERDIHAAPLEGEIARLATNEGRLLSAIERACHAWNQTPTEYRSPLMQEAVNELSAEHQAALRNTPKK